MVAIDTGEDKAKMCKELGAEAFIDFAKTHDIPAEVHRLTDGGAQVVLVTGGSGKAYENAYVLENSLGIYLSFQQTSTVAQNRYPSLRRDASEGYCHCRRRGA